MHRAKARRSVIAALVMMWLVPAGRLEAQQITAVAGEPWGVAEFTWNADERVSPLLLQNRGWSLTSSSGRVFFATIQPRLREDGLLAEVLGREGAAARRLSVSFLFNGSDPFEVILDDGQPHTLRVVPRPPRRRELARLLDRWWRNWQQEAARAEGPGAPLLADLMTYQVAQETGRTPTDLAARQASSDETLRTLQLAFGGEGIRAQVRRATLFGPHDRREAPDQPLPAPTIWQPLVLEPLEPPPLEPIATHVPPECFYIRFGSFPNYLWFNRLLTDNGGDLASLVAPAPVRGPGSERFQQQIGLKQSALAEVLGPAVIADVALIGTDLYFADGAAMGILFQARNALLGNDLVKQRQTALAAFADQGGREETVQIAGRTVSFISTPDNRLRSFYVVDGDYHLVTNSRHLVQRFLEVGGGEASLGSLAEFHHARGRLPLEREDTLFLYFSTPFFQNLVTPHYQIELQRRLRAATDIQLLFLATQQARSRGLAAESPFDLVDAGLLPPGILARPEGGEIQFVGEPAGDSLRGGRGTFLPIPDIEITGATRTEVREYVRRSAYYAANVKQFDPLMIGIQRSALNNEGLERIAIEAHISPLDATKYGRWLSLLGPPTTQQITPPPGDIISVQAHVQGGLFSGTIPPHVLFLGIQDLPPAPSGPGLLQGLSTLRATPGYIGAWPKPGFLDWLPLRLGGGAPDPAGYSSLPLGLWRRQWADFSAISFQRPVLDAVTPQLAPVEAADPAQVRVAIGDLSQSHLRGLINNLTAERAAETTTGTTRFLHQLEQWLGLPRPATREVAEELLDGQLVCPLGGTFELLALPGATPFWASSAQVGEAAAPADYQAPVLGWYRGLTADLSRTDAGVVLRAELDMQRAPSAPAAELPLFNFFKSQRPATATRKEF